MTDDWTTYIIAYVATLIVFLAIDITWLRMVAVGMFESRIGDIMAEKTKMGVALAFYVFYVTGIVYFAILPGLNAESFSLAAANGAFLGLLAYGTYEATNMATLRGWDWTLVVTDTAWGAFVTGLSAVLGMWLTRSFMT